MAILVTRPQPDNAATAAALRAAGYEPLSAPMLRFEQVAMPEEPDARYGAVIVTSANALRAMSGAALAPLLALPLYAVGETTAAAARGAGFRDVIVADGDAASLRDLASQGQDAKGAKKGIKGSKALKASDPLLYLAGADLSRDLAGELGARGFTVVTHTTYRMVPVAMLPADAADAFAAGRIQAVLHYSRRSARAFTEASRAAGVEISALALPQCCLSDAIAEVIRDSGAAQVMVARSPNEAALFEVLGRAISPISR